MDMRRKIHTALMILYHKLDIEGRENEVLEKFSEFSEALYDIYDEVDALLLDHIRKIDVPSNFNNYDEIAALELMDSQNIEIPQNLVNNILNNENNYDFCQGVFRPTLHEIFALLKQYHNIHFDVVADMPFGMPWTCDADYRYDLFALLKEPCDYESLFKDTQMALEKWIYNFKELVAQDWLKDNCAYTNYLSLGYMLHALLYFIFHFLNHSGKAAK